MRRSALTFLILATALGAADALELRIRIMAQLAKLLITKERPIIYMPPKEYEVAKNFAAIRTTQRCKEADILFIHTPRSLPAECLFERQPMIILLSYKSYLQNRHRAVGAFFWQKGRPNIILNRTLIQNLGITIPDEYKKYEE